MIKRVFDVFFAIIGLLFLSWFIFICFIIVSFDYKSNGFFIQTRIGQFGKPFQLYKLRTMHPKSEKISKLGAYLRKTKLDELPQLWNILKGEMSFVGPRPDIPGYYDQLQGEARKILELKPGLTCEASIKYANEEEILAQQQDPLHYNDTVIFPDKVRMNLEYYYNRSFLGDLKIIWKTLVR